MGSEQFKKGDRVLVAPREGGRGEPRTVARDDGTTVWFTDGSTQTKGPHIWKE